MGCWISLLPSPALPLPFSRSLFYSDSTPEPSLSFLVSLDVKEARNFSCPSGLELRADLLFDTMNDHSSPFHKHLPAPRLLEKLC